MQGKTLKLLLKAEAAGELRTAVAAVAQARQNVEVLGKLRGLLPQEGTVNITVSAEGDPVEALELARKAYAYVARVLHPDATLEAVGRADRAVLKAEERQDFAGYEEAMRELCKTARREARRRAA
ncbi:MAG: hypothetical protein K0S10_2841 [Rubrobacteraceae bacterium]|nr:hypothetical protein [Rubrobacteraceae bacterium]